MEFKIRKVTYSIIFMLLLVFQGIPGTNLSWGMKVNAAIGNLYWPVRNSSGTCVTGITAGRGYSSYHNGIDINNSAGCNWYAAYSGKVYKVFKGCYSNGYNTGGHTECSPRYDRTYMELKDENGNVTYSGYYCNYGFGNGVIIECNINGTLYYMQYAHMDTVASNLYEGQSISQGTYLGTVGDRGFSFGTHAHFEIDKGQWYNSSVNNDPSSSGCQFNYNYGSIDSTGPNYTDFHTGEIRIDGTGFTVMAKVTDPSGIKSVQYAVWTEKDGQDDLHWYDGYCTDGNDYYWHRINFSDHNNEKGKYIIHMYAYDNAGNLTNPGISFDFDSTGPTYSDFHVGEFREGAFTILANVTDINEIEYVQYAVWTEKDGQDDLHWYDGYCTDGNNYYWTRINFIMGQLSRQKI